MQGLLLNGIIKTKKDSQYEYDSRNKSSHLILHCVKNSLEFIMIKHGAS